MCIYISYIQFANVRMYIWKVHMYIIPLYKFFYLYTVPNSVGVVNIECAAMDFNNTCTVTWSVSNLISVLISTP